MCSACRERRRVEATGEDVTLIITTPPRASTVTHSESGSAVAVSSAYVPASAGGIVDPNSLSEALIPSASDSGAAAATAASKPHWLDYAKLSFPVRDVEDVKRVWYILPIFMVLPIFWMLFDQQGSTWVLQAKSMDRVYVVSFSKTHIAAI